MSEATPTTINGTVKVLTAVIGAGIIALCGTVIVLRQSVAVLTVEVRNLTDDFDDIKASTGDRYTGQRAEMDFAKRDSDIADLRDRIRASEDKHDKLQNQTQRNTLLIEQLNAKAGIATMPRGND